MAFEVLFFYGVSSLCISSLTVIGNAMTLFAFYHEKSLRINPSNNFIIALTINDLLYGIHIFFFLGIPFTFQRTHGYFFGETGCMMTVFLNHLFVIGNLLLLAISVDRLLLICLKYSNYVKFQTTSRVGIGIAMCYVAGVTLGVIEMSMWEFAKKDKTVAAKINFNRYCISPPRNQGVFGLLLSFGFYVTPITLVFLLNVVFFALLIRKIRKRGQVGSTQSSIRTGGTSLNSIPSRSGQNGGSSLGANLEATQSQNMSGSTPPKNDNTGDAHTKSRYVKPAITLAVLVGAMAISNLPYCTYLVVIAFCSSCRDPIMVRYWLLVCQLNSLLDPLFYTFTQRKLREYYKKKFQRLFASFNR
ncbi:5-hydroxytryptamine receptor 1D-like [Amphiura filiformis]|uniref:5-hydroxytryptamine receptor 1D-like n=1 Tax=Amphiura filiformis TaxID=82378 RepID=UPI003B22092D